jgi:Planctomycete cytochrome C
VKWLPLFLYVSAFAASRPECAECFFDKRVAPILEKRCLGCHNRELKNGGISFPDRDSLLTDHGRGPAIVPGKPEASVLIQTLRHDGDIQMPPGPKLSSREIGILREWIERGAVWGTKLQPKK